MIGCLTETTTCVVAKPLVINNLVNFKKYAFMNLISCQKEGGRGRYKNFSGVWHKTDLNVKYTLMGCCLQCYGRGLGRSP